MKLSKLKEIRRLTNDSLLKDNRENFRIKKKWKRIFTFYTIPLFLSILLISLGRYLDKDAIQYFITGIAIFAGLFFNLLIVVSDKVQKRLTFLNSNYEPTAQYNQDYKNEGEKLIASITYAIILSIVVISLMFISQINFNILSEICINNEIISKVNLITKCILNVVAYFAGFKFLILLIHILTSIYTIFIGDMNPKWWQIKNEKE